MKMKKIFMCIISFLVLAGMWLLNFSGFSVLAETEPSKSHPNAVVYEAEDAKLSGGALKTACLLYTSPLRGRGTWMQL